MLRLSHTSSEILLFHQHHRGLPVTVVSTAPQSDSLTDFSTENFFEIAIVKFGLRGVGKVDAGERFRCCPLARYCNLQRLSTPMEAKQGVLLEAVITCTGIPVDTWSLSELWPISWRLEKHRGSQFADIL